MARYQSGDSDAVEELVRRISPVLWRYFESPYLDRSDTEDLLQECWMRIHRSRHTWRPADPLLPWVFAIARHTRIDVYRRRRRRESREHLVGALPDVGQFGSGASALETAHLDELLAALPESQREVILMLKVSGMTVDEVARATASTAGAIKQKAHRAYARLRQMLDQGFQR